MSPLPDSITATLRSDPTAALAALMVIAGAHADLFAWAARMACEPARSRPAPPKPEPQAATPPAARKASLANGGANAHLALRREARDRDDKNLLQAMREEPDSLIGGWAKTIGKSRTSVIDALHRFRDAGLATNEDGRWALVGPVEELDEADLQDAPRSAARWVAPLSAASHA